jgi:hypothetical protein
MPSDADVEPVVACEPWSEAALAALELRKQRESEEAADFTTRQVLERGATFFGG